jgi:DNA-binding XRE family transcriptional regulator
MTFGEKIKAARLRLNMSQETIAHELGVSFAKLIHINPSITADAMATAIGIAPRNVEENIKN